ncbi:MAG: hypothetical protein HZA93_03920 [Verrucomicrobia bacterium]|nr:hypothetical protein [Verrucomicrobiota bacterium]
MTSAPANPVCKVIRYKRPPRARGRSPLLRLEGSLAAVATLAPVIPIFPALALAAEHRATSALPHRCHLLGDMQPGRRVGELPAG